MADTTVLAKPEVQFDGNRRATERRACLYCWSTFEVKRYGQDHCSAECSRRESAWDGWVRLTRQYAIGGDVNRAAKTGQALPPAGRTLFDAVASARVDTTETAVA